MNRVLTSVLLCIVSSTNGLKPRDLGISEEYDQEWGFIEKPITNEKDFYPQNPKYSWQAIDTNNPRLKRATLPEECSPLNKTTPDFNRPGRRISEVKCQEYFWGMLAKLEELRRFRICFIHEHPNSRPTTIGGMKTGPGEYPHMGAIGWKAAVGTWVFKCGSSLISDKFVMTAAHCTKGSEMDPTIADPVPKIVRLGDKNIIDMVFFMKPIDANIKKIIVHPQYSSPKKYFDIALIELDRSVSFTKFIRPACLWTSVDTSKLGKEITLTGWGEVESGSLRVSPELMAASVDIIDSPTCNRLLNGSCNRNWCGLHDDQICAGKLVGGVDACQGDSGGPLQAKIPQRSTDQGQMHYVFGIISFGVGCARPNKPGIYTKVSSFIDWIEDNVWRNQ